LALCVNLRATVVVNFAAGGEEDEFLFLHNAGCVRANLRCRPRTHTTQVNGPAPGSASGTSFSTASGSAMGSTWLRFTSLRSPPSNSKPTYS
jgi:hypothetical protein